MARYKETERTEYTRKPCECGKGVSITYKVVKEADEVLDDQITYETEIKCKICNSGGK